MKQKIRGFSVRYLGLLSVVFLLAVPVNSVSLFNDQMEASVITESIQVSEPLFMESSEGISVSVAECSNVLAYEGGPQVPMYTLQYDLPFGSKNIAVEVEPIGVYEERLGGSLALVPLYQQVGSQQRVGDTSTFDSEVFYPELWYDVIYGAGLDATNQHVIKVIIQMYPVRYRSVDQMVSICSSFDVSVDYCVEETMVGGRDSYDLVIISPAEYEAALQPLVNHKVLMGLSVLFQSYEDIRSSYAGRDGAEDIKFFVRDAVEQMGVSYVLLVGDVQTIPTRVTYASPWEPDILSDLYFADLYNSDSEFCSWDANENDLFGEVQQLGGWPPQINNLDAVDLFADVHIGRLACVSEAEVSLVVQKIITYELSTYGSEWFSRLVVAGGDTFPVGMGAIPFVYEGEITNQQVLDEMPEFEHVTLWATQHRLNAVQFNKAINDGAGFVTYAGHGFEHGWSTYRPNSLRRKMTFSQPLYYTPFIQYLNNEDELPIMFFDACLTAKLDFNVTDLLQYYRKIMTALIDMGRVDADPSVYYPCFAWRFLTEPDGGAIATVGATRTAYSWVDTNGAHAGAGYLDVAFFKAYEPGCTVGMMLTNAQNDYIANVYRDFFTIEEYVLLGDPSLMVGGYPTN